MIDCGVAKTVGSKAIVALPPLLSTALIASRRVTLLPNCVLKLVAGLSKASLV